MKILAAIVTGILSFASIAQEEVIIIDRSKLNYTKPKKEVRFNENIQVIKFAPLNMLGGEILFGYERQLNAKGSFDVELGPTISKIGFGITTHYGGGFEPQIDELSGMGVVFGVSYRYYPLDETEALNRFYVAPQFRYKLLNHKVQDFSEFVPGIQKGNQTNANFLFNFGYQAWLSETFAMDMYIGLGIGMRTETDWYSEQYYEDNTWKYRWVETYGSGARYLLNAGIKVGIGSK